MRGQMKKRASVYLPMIQEIRDEARRLDRPIVWVMVLAWKLARKQIKAQQPGVGP